MARVRSWVRGFDDQDVWPLIPSGGDGIVGLAGTVVDSGGIQRETLMRAIFWPRLAVNVFAASDLTPPENWWFDTNVWFAAWVGIHGDHVGPSPFSHDPRIICQGMLTPTLTPSPTGVTGYYVSYDYPAGAIDTEGRRRWDGDLGHQLEVNFGYGAFSTHGGLRPDLYPAQDIRMGTFYACEFLGP